MCIVLSIVTCGLYSFYWMYSITNDVAQIKQDNGYRSGGMVVLLSIVTCGIYTIYWIFVTSRDIYYSEQDLSLRTSDNTVINVVLCLFTFSIIPLAIMQSSINKISDELYNR